MKEELTTKMLGEFKVSDVVDIKHRCFSALKSIELGFSILEVTELYNVTEEQINRYKEKFNLLSSI